MAGRYGVNEVVVLCGMRIRIVPNAYLSFLEKKLTCLRKRCLSNKVHSVQGRTLALRNGGSISALVSPMPKGFQLQ